jgi:hypothetical protein
MRVTVDYSENLEGAIAGSRERFDRIIAAGLSDMAHELVMAAQARTKPGPYQRSFRAAPVVGMSVEAGSDSPIASILERGRRPGGRPPAQSIRKRKGGSQEAAERAADRIAARGTKGMWTVKKSVAQVRSDGTIERIARAALAAAADLKG